MNIVKAVSAFDKGRRIFRAGWDHNETLGFETAARFVGGNPSGAYMSSQSGNTYLYQFTLDDIRSDDWASINGATRPNNKELSK